VTARRAVAEVAEHDVVAPAARSESKVNGSSSPESRSIMPSEVCGHDPLSGGVGIPVGARGVRAGWLATSSACRRLVRLALGSGRLVDRFLEAFV
jgi:hypothetical protein